jgi:hypothetical protein
MKVAHFFFALGFVAMVSAMSQILRLSPRELPESTRAELLEHRFDPRAMKRILGGRSIRCSPEHLLFLQRFMGGPESFRVLFKRTVFPTDAEQVRLLEYALLKHHVVVSQFLAGQRFSVPPADIEPGFFKAFWSGNPFDWTQAELRELLSFPKMAVFRPQPAHAQFCASPQARHVYAALMADQAAQGNPGLLNEVLLAATGERQAVFLSDAGMAVLVELVLEHATVVDWNGIIDQLHRFHPDNVRTLKTILASLKPGTPFSISQMPAPWTSGRIREFYEAVVQPYGYALDAMLQDDLGGLLQILAGSPHCGLLDLLQMLRHHRFSQQLFALAQEKKVACVHGPIAAS